MAESWRRGSPRHLDRTNEHNRTVCPILKYVDDSTIWEVCNRDGSDSVLQTAADQASQWTDENNMILNTDKTKIMETYFGEKPLNTQPVTVNGTPIECVNVFKLLGIMINSNLSWHNHVDYICSKASTKIYYLILLKRAGISPTDIVQVYCSIVRSVLEYACEVWHPGLTTVMNDSIERIQKRALSISYPDCCYEEALGVAKLDRLNIRRNSRCKRFFQTMQASSHKLNYLLPP